MSAAQQGLREWLAFGYDAQRGLSHPENPAAHHLPLSAMPAGPLLINVRITIEFFGEIRGGDVGPIHMRAWCEMELFEGSAF